MAIKITNDCIGCGACVPECPNGAIYETGAEWRFSDGTKAKGIVKGLSTGIEADADDPQPPVSNEVFYIAADKCTECKGFHDEPQCMIVCPVDTCVPDENHVETEDLLLAKKNQLHT